VFEKRANDLQTKLYQEDPELAMELMLAEQTVWDIKVTPLECAFDFGIVPIMCYFILLFFHKRRNIDYISNH
jgi:hypothetical protein